MATGSRFPSGRVVAVSLMRDGRVRPGRIDPSACVAALSLLLTATHGILRAEDSQPIQVESRNPHYFRYQDKPIVLVTTDHTWFALTAPDFDYVAFLDALAENDNNFTRLYPGAHPVNY